MSRYIESAVKGKSRLNECKPMASAAVPEKVSWNGNQIIGEPSRVAEKRFNYDAAGFDVNNT